MAKHKLWRDHLNKKKGDLVELTEEQEQYFLRVGLIKEQTKEYKTKEDPAPKKMAKK